MGTIEDPLDDDNVTAEIIKIKRQGFRDTIIATRIILIVGDRSYLNKTEKHNLKLIEEAINTLTESLLKSYEPKK
jgi:DNA repair photolyase